MFKDLKFTFTDDDNISILKNEDKFKAFAFEACYESWARVSDYMMENDGIDVRTTYRIVVEVFHEKFNGKLSPTILRELYLSHSTIISALDKIEEADWDDIDLDEADGGWDA